MTLHRVIRASIGGGAVRTVDVRSPAPLMPATRSKRWMVASQLIAPPISSHTTTSGQKYSTSEVPCKTPDYPVAEFLLGFSNWWTLSTGTTSPPEVDGSNDIAVRASISFDSGATWAPLTFGGAAEVTITPGDTVFCDTVILNAAVTAADCRVRTYCSVPATGSTRPGCYRRGNYVPGIPGNFLVGARYTATQSEALGLLNGGAIVDNSNGAAVSTYGPSILACRQWDGRGVVLVVGDSISALNSRMSWCVRAVEDTTGGLLRLPVANFGVAGTRPTNQTGTAPGYYRRKAQIIRKLTALNGGLLPFTNIFSEMAVNSMTNGKLSRFQGYMRAWWAFLRAEFQNAPITQASATPKTYYPALNDTFWTTYPDQVPYEDDRWPWNASLPGEVSAGNIDHFIDNTSLWTDPASSSPHAWRVPGQQATLVSDYASQTPYMTLDTPLPLGTVPVPAGLTGASSVSILGTLTGTGPYQMGYNGEDGLWGQSFPAGTIVKAATVRDGLHPQEPTVSLAAANVRDNGKALGYFGPARAVDLQ